MADISLTASMRSNLLQLQATTKLMDMTQEKISTGKKINSALDGPVEFFTAKGLTDRAGDFAALKDNMGQAISAVETSTKTLDSVNDLVAQMKGLATSAKAATTSAERSDLASQFDDLRSQIDALVGDSTYNGVNLVQGRGAITGGSWSTSGKADIDAISGYAATTISTAPTGSEELNIDFAVQQNINGTTGTATGGGTFTTGSGAELDLAVGTTAGGDGWTSVNADISGTVSADGATLTLSDGTNSVQIATANIDATGGAATVATLGDLTISLQFDADASADLAWVANGSDADLFDTSADGTVADARIVGTYDASSVTFDDGTLSHTVKGHTITFGAETLASTVAGETASVSITNSTGVGANDMSVVFNQDGTASINVNAVDATASGLAISTAVNSWATDADIDSAITDVDAARDTLRDQTRQFATNLGVIQTREDFTSEFVNALQAGADKLTLADGNEEAANMLALQTRQQLGIQALSMASQSAQAVLSLFR